MANPDHMKVIRAGGEAVAARRKVNPSERLDLESADLYRAKLDNIDLSSWEADIKKFEEQFERVVKALRADDAARPAPPESKL